VKDEEIVDWSCRIANGLGESIGGLNGKACPIKGAIKRAVAIGHCPRRCVPDNLPEPEILEKIAGIDLAHHAPLPEPNRPHSACHWGSFSWLLQQPRRPG
jgi:hypothetical protein